MTSTLFWRLVWKEYRVQRSLWLALLAAVVVLQLVIGFLTFGPDRAQLFPMLVSLGCMLGWFYALGAGAISFAMEREEDTQIRLVTMVCPAGLSTIVKLVCSSFGTLLFMVSIIGSAWLIAPPKLDEEMWLKMRHDFMPVVTMFAGAELLALVFGMVCSLYSQKVLTALIVGGVSCVLFETTLVSIIVEANGGRSPSESLLQFLMALGTAGLVLLPVLFLRARSWLNRDFVARPLRSLWSWLPVVRFVHVQRDGSILIGGASEERFRVKSVKEALATRAPSRISWCAALLFDRRRQHEGRFLIWRELVETRMMFCVALLALWLLNLPNVGSFGMSAVPESWIDSPFVAASLFAAVMCGFMTFRQEQSGKQFLFLTYRGLAPTTVWRSKQLAWSWRLLLSLGVLNFVPLCVNSTRWLLHFFGRSNVNYFVESGTLPPGVQHTFASVTAVPSMLVLYFAIGQFASLFAARTVVSFFFASVLGFVAAAWIAMTHNLGVPEWMTAVPVSLALIGATFIRTREWMMERSTTGNALRIFGGLASGLTVCIALIGWHRATEFPDVLAEQQRLNAPAASKTPLYGSWSEPSLNRTPYEQQLATLLAPVSADDRQRRIRTRDRLDHLRLTRLIAPASDDRTSTKSAARPNPQALVAEWQALVAQQPFALASALELHQDDSEAQRSAVLVVSSLLELRSLSDEYLADAQPRLALDLYLVSLKLYVDAQRCANLRISDSRIVLGVLAALREWSARADVTTEMREKAIAGLSEFLREVPTPEAFAQAEWAFARELLNRRDLDDWLQQRMVDESNTREPDFVRQIFASVIRLPGETERMRRVLNILHFEGERANAAVASGRRMAFQQGNSNLNDMHRQLTALQHLREFHQRATQTTPLLRLFPLSINENLWHRHLEIETDVRATILMIALIDEHLGKPAPATLELKRKFDLKLLNPTTGKEFDWWPHGLPPTVESKLPVTAHKPFLLNRSRGDSSLRLFRVKYFKPEEMHPGMAMGGAAGMPFGVAGGEGGASSPTTPHEPEPTAEDLLSGRIPLHAELIAYSKPYETGNPPKLYEFPASIFAPREPNSKPAWLQRLEKEPFYLPEGNTAEAVE